MRRLFQYLLHKLGKSIGRDVVVATSGEVMFCYDTASCQVKKEGDCAPDSVLGKWCCQATTSKELPKGTYGSPGLLLDMYT